MRRTKYYDYDVAISYAGEDRNYAEALAIALDKRKVKVFYDKYEQAMLWGKNLYPYLSELYQDRARYCVMFLSRHYAEKLWTNHEREAAQARAFQENEEYILPVRLDNTKIPGLLPTVAYLSWPPADAETLADAIITKLGREPYIPQSQFSTVEAMGPTVSLPDVATLSHSKSREHKEVVVLQTYLEKIETTYLAGKTTKITELTYRSALEELLPKLAAGITVIHEPAREDYGSPDFMISRSTGHGPLRVGYIETKDVDANLDEIERDAQRTEPKTRDGQQLKKYRLALDNLVLTNYREFRWYLHGEHRMIASLISPIIDKGIAIKKKGRKKNSETPFTQLMIGMHGQSSIDVARLLVSFLTHSTEPINNPKELAVRMARITHIIRDMAVIALNQGEVPAFLQDLYNAFKKVLLPDLDVAQFADMFAQTLAYGLFAARYNHKGNEPFRRQIASREIPNTNPFLADLFEKITGRELDNVPFIGFVDDLAQLLAQTDMNAVLADFGKRTRQEDPLVHFYETFLAQYDPKLRELRGVYYTPEPIVSYIVQSVDHLLRTQFQCDDGLAHTSQTVYTWNDEYGVQHKKSSPRVFILDPACGTGTFLYTVINHIRETYRQKKNAGMWSSYVREHILPRLFGFEMLMAPYAMAHLKLGMQLGALDLPEAQRSSWTYDFKGHERLGLYLTNTLEQSLRRSEMLFARYISDEANAAAEIKNDLPIMVIMGNPPYSGHSANRSWKTEDNKEVLTFIGKLLQDYYKVDGHALEERNPKWLQDDYVKFIRFAQWRIERTGYGILAFITNHGYLDNPTFRGMRQSLLQSFDEIYVLDLHGNSKKKERSPSGAKDENVFDIQQGVAISIFVKQPGESDSFHRAMVYHAHLWGLRPEKYHWLSENYMKTTEWVPVNPQAPFYLFVPQDGDLKKEYEQGWKITDIMPVNGWGIATRKDYLLVDFSRERLVHRFQDIRTLTAEEAIARYGIKESPHWNFPEAKKQLSADVENHVKPVLFRPFDTRFLYYQKCMIERGDHRFDLMSHMFQENISFITVRRAEVAGIPHHFYCSNEISVLHSTSAKEGNFVFPLYLYPTSQKKTLFDTSESVQSGRVHNIASAFITAFSHCLGIQFIPNGKGDLRITFGPEDIFNYMYAVFHSLTYRERYAELLKVDFPRLPCTSNIDLFRLLCGLGHRLVMLHLMMTSGKAMPTYPVSGTDLIEKVEHTAQNDELGQGRVWINKEQYFAGIPLQAWEFYVGGYQVCQKWLKDRKGHFLTYEDIQHYQRIVAAIIETIALMRQIDEVIMEHGNWPIT